MKNCGRKSKAYLAFLFTYYLEQIISLWLSLYHCRKNPPISEALESRQVLSKPYMQRAETVSWK